MNDIEGPRDGYKALVEAFVAEAVEARKDALRFGRRHRRLHVCVGLAAVCFGAAAGSLGALELGELSAVAGVLAAIAAGAQGFLKAPVLAQFHFEQAALFGELARRFKLMANAPTPPSATDLEALVAEWQQVEARSLKDLEPAGAEP